MSDPAICTPGRMVGEVQTVAAGGGFVLLEPEPGTEAGFGAFEAATCMVTLHDRLTDSSHELAVGPDPEFPAWTEHAIVAQLPAALHGGVPGVEELDLQELDGSERLFEIRITTAGAAFAATDVAVIGAPTSGYPTKPPTHHLFGSWSTA